MLRSITVSNFRSFKDPATLELRPITLFLGRNSSGKSTLTRLFPLLRQSAEKQNAAPVLWVSDAVDFGSVNDVLHNHSPGAEIEITFLVDGAGLNSGPLRQGMRSLASQFPVGAIRYSIFLSSVANRTTLSRLVICIEDQRIEAKFQEDGTLNQISVNDKVFVSGAESENIFVDTTTMFPDFLRLYDPASETGAIGQYRFYPNVTPALSYFIHGRTKQSTLDYIGRQMLFVPRKSLPQYLKQLPNVVQSRTSDGPALDNLSDALLVNDIPRIVSFVAQTLNPVFQSVAYLGPVRAHGNRFYRIQELSVRSIDARGENLPMYLISLTPTELKQYNDLLYQTCGYIVRVEPSGPGHVTVQIGRSSKDSFENVADVGFGFTQLLPVVAQLHAAIAEVGGPQASVLLRKSGEKTSVIAIEQPELHLHPALQANLADLLVATIDQGPKGLRMVLETHSETLIGRLGALVATGVLKSEDVGIYFVEKDDDLRESRVRFAELDGSGLVKNWPVGFFSADV